MQKVKEITIVALMSFALGAGVFAQERDTYIRAFTTNDAAPILRVQNTGNELVTFKWTVSSNLSVIIGTVTNTTTYIGLSNTVSQTATGVKNCTNSSGDKVLNVEYYCSVGADTVTNLFKLSTNTIASGNHEWNDVGTWLCVSNLAYYTYIAPQQNPMVIESIDGNIAGTGNITIDVYKHKDSDDTQTKVWTHTIVSPVYVWASITSITNSNASDDVTPGIINLKPLISVGRGEGVVVKAARATTATGAGGVGVTARVLGK